MCCYMFCGAFVVRFMGCVGLYLFVTYIVCCFCCRGINCGFGVVMFRGDWFLKLVGFCRGDLDLHQLLQLFAEGLFDAAVVLCLVVLNIYLFTFSCVVVLAGLLVCLRFALGLGWYFMV